MQKSFVAFHLTAHIHFIGTMFGASNALSLFGLIEETAPQDENFVM